jgi:hypothetical protein
MKKPTPVVLGLVGPSGSGKTTVCTYLQKEYGFLRLHVATPLKEAFQKLTGLEPAFCETPLIEDPHHLLGGVTPRAVLEHLGTELHKIAPMTLPLRCAQHIDRLIGGNLSPPYILVDGIRRPYEADMVHYSFGGKVIRMLGHSVDPTKPCDLSQEYVTADFTLTWSPTKDQLYAQIDEIMASFLGVTKDARAQQNRDPDRGRIDVV